jgi:hypothetical protein
MRHEIRSGTAMAVVFEVYLAQKGASGAEQAMALRTSISRSLHNSRWLSASQAKKGFRQVKANRFEICLTPSYYHLLRTRKDT